METRVPQQGGSDIAGLESVIRSIPGWQGMSPYQLDQALTQLIGHGLPAGYQLQPNGQLKYVALPTDQHAGFVGTLLQPKVAFPALLGGGLLAGSLLGGGAAAAGAGAGADASAGAVPTITGTSYGTGMAGAIPSITGASAGGGGVLNAAGNAIGSGLGSVVKNVVAGTGGSALDKILKATIGGLSGLPALMSSKNGPSDQEKALMQQAQDLLSQANARTKYQDPLYRAVTQMAFGLLPNQSGNYPGGA